MVRRLGGNKKNKIIRNLPQQQKKKIQTPPRIRRIDAEGANEAQKKLERLTQDDRLITGSCCYFLLLLHPLHALLQNGPLCPSPGDAGGRLNLLDDADDRHDKTLAVIPTVGTCINLGLDEINVDSSSGGIVNAGSVTRFTDTAADLRKHPDNANEARRIEAEIVAQAIPKRLRVLLLLLLLNQSMGINQ
jgi:hypothetical protein